MQETIKRTLVYCPQHAFLAPYFGRAYGHEFVFVCDRLPSELPADIYYAVMISSTQLYAPTEGRNLDENTPVNTSSEWHTFENEFNEFCSTHNLKPLVLRCANVVATGMNGLTMRLARGIDNGTLCHIKGNEAEISVVHGVDVAAAALRLMLKEGVYNITDGSHTRIDQLIDALAHRINDKNIFTLPRKAARLLYGKTYFNLLTTTLLFDNGKFVRDTNDMPMHNVCRYLLTHNYDDESL